MTEIERCPVCRRIDGVHAIGCPAADGFIRSKRDLWVRSESDGVIELRAGRNGDDEQVALRAGETLTEETNSNLWRLLSGGPLRVHAERGGAVTAVRDWYRPDLLVTVSRTKTGDTRIHYTTSTGECSTETLAAFERRERKEKFVRRLLMRLQAETEAAERDAIADALSCTPTPSDAKVQKT